MTRTDQAGDVAVVGNEEARQEVHDCDATQIDRILKEYQINIVDRHAADLDEDKADTQQDRQNEASQRVPVEVRGRGSGIVAERSRLNGVIVIVLGVKVVSCNGRHSLFFWSWASLLRAVTLPYRHSPQSRYASTFDTFCARG